MTTHNRSDFENYLDIVEKIEIGDLLIGFSLKELDDILSKLRTTYRGVFLLMNNNCAKISTITPSSI